MFQNFFFQSDSNERSFWSGFIFLNGQEFRVGDAVFLAPSAKKVSRPSDNSRDLDSDESNQDAFPVKISTCFIHQC